MGYQMTAYEIPIGYEIVIGNRRWKLIHRMENHPDMMRFHETTTGEHEPLRGRVFYPSEVQFILDAYSNRVELANARECLRKLHVNFCTEEVCNLDGGDEHAQAFAALPAPTANREKK